MSDPRETGQSSSDAAEFKSPTTPTRPRRTQTRLPLKARFAGAVAGLATIGAITFGTDVGVKPVFGQDLGTPTTSSASDSPLGDPLAGITIQSDGAGQPSPDNETPTIEVAAVVMDARLTPLIAGGEFMDPGAFGDRLFRPAGGPTILLSPDARAAVNFELTSLGMSQGPADIELYALGKWGPSLAKVDMSQDPITVVDGSRVLSFQGNKVFQITEAGSTEVQFTTTNDWYKPETRWMDGMGLVATDGYRVTHQQVNGRWQELKNYIPLGTTKERTNKYLKDSMGQITDRSGNTVTNIFDLRSEEVEQFLKDPQGKTDGFQSFKAIRNNKGEPAIILVTGGKYGLKKDLGNVQSVEEAFAKIPDLVDLLNIQLGLSAITGDAAPGGTFQRVIVGTTFDEKLGILLFNETPSTTNPKYPMFSALLRIVTEARGIYDRRHFEENVFLAPDRVSNKDGVDKNLWAKPLFEARKDRFKPEDYASLMTRLNDYIIFYSNA